ncbi:MAG: type II toxin-antitoxin system HicA family toxin [Candidatus Competibacteraceae bacterium]|mgnify:CR=1 FL=1|nr:MAG: type II toxin-antitoxin system HicA family toxin [Candidatus Competibacteraceae bacterium]
MSHLPRLSGKEVVETFERLGWEVVRRRSSHIIMVREGRMATLSIPDHREVAQGTLRSLIRSSGMTVDEFTKTSK